MRVSKWRDREVFSQIKELAIIQANYIMDEFVKEVKPKIPVSPIVREGKWSGHGIVSFTPKKGRNKGNTRTFLAKRWLGRNPGDLRNTVRKVNKHDRPNNVRVYVGNTKIYWAFMVERGNSKIKAVHFLRNTFKDVQATAKERLEKGIAANMTEFLNRPMV